MHADGRQIHHIHIGMYEDHFYTALPFSVVGAEPTSGPGAR